MKTRLYIRVGKNGGKYTASASTKSNEDPIFLPKTYTKEKQALPTVGFAVDFEIPDELFSKASVLVASINIATKDGIILGQIPKVAKKK